MNTSIVPLGGIEQAHVASNLSVLGTDFDGDQTQAKITWADAFSRQKDLGLLVLFCAWLSRNWITKVYSSPAPRKAFGFPCSGLNIEPGPYGPICFKYSS